MEATLRPKLSNVSISIITLYTFLKIASPENSNASYAALLCGKTTKTQGKFAQDLIFDEMV